MVPQLVAVDFESVEENARHVSLAASGPRCNDMHLFAIGKMQGNIIEPGVILASTRGHLALLDRNRVR